MLECRASEGRHRPLVSGERGGVTLVAASVGVCRRLSATMGGTGPRRVDVLLGSCGSAPVTCAHPLV
jgi:hypothetical protein